MSGVKMKSDDGRRLPFLSDGITTDPEDSDHETVIRELWANPLPVTVTIVPGGPTVGFRVSVGVPG